MSDPYADPTGSPGSGQPPEQQPPAQPPALPSLGFVRDLINEVRLTWRLLRDRRVPWGLKLIVPASLAYVLMPLDLIPDVALGLGQLDDLAVLLIGTRMFVELCPPEIVREHRQALVAESGGSAAPQGEGPVIDAGGWKVVNPPDQQGNPPDQRPNP